MNKVAKTTKGTAKAKRPTQAEHSGAGPVHPLLHLQQGLGNRLLSELLDGQVQRQGGPEEEELLQGKPDLQRQEEEELLQGKPEVQRQEEEELLQGKPDLQRQEDEEVMTKPDGSPSTQAHAAIESRRGQGQGLEGGLRQRAEAALGFDFKGVRLHADSEADRLARGLKAKAFTKGKDIFFRGKDFNPHSAEGRELIGHELTHVVQQHEGLEEGAGRAGDKYEQEADRVGAAVFREAAPKGGLPEGLGNRAVNGLLGQPLQRQVEETPPWEKLPASAAPEPAPWEPLPQSKGPSVGAAKPAAKAPKPDKGAPESQGGVYTGVKGALTPFGIADMPRRVSNTLAQGRGILKSKSISDKLATKAAGLYGKVGGVLEKSRVGGRILQAGQALDPAKWGKFGKATSPLGLVDLAANVVGAPKGVTDVTGVAAGATPIGAAQAGVATAGQTAWNMAKGGVTSLVRGRVGKGSWEGLEKQNEAMLASKSPVAGYNMIGRMITDPKETADKLVSKEAASGKLGPLAQAGNWLGDKAFEATSPLLKWLARRKLKKKK